MDIKISLCLTIHHLTQRKKIPETSNNDIHCIYCIQFSSRFVYRYAQATANGKSRNMIMMMTKMIG